MFEEHQSAIRALIIGRHSESVRTLSADAASVRSEESEQALARVLTIGIILKHDVC